MIWTFPTTSYHDTRQNIIYYVQYRVILIGATRVDFLGGLDFFL